MYKVLKPLKGYGYLVGNLVDNLKEEDISYFLHWKMIELVKVEKPVKTKK